MMRGPKKNATIEVRLPYAVKHAFMAQCRAQGCTASDVVRPVSCAGTAAAWTLFVFRDAQPDIAPFQELDRNGDGVVAWSEFLV
jgi:hypothetical protein